MRPRALPSTFVLALALALTAPCAAQAGFAHVVEPGESLSSVAATDGLTVSELAAANGLSTEAELIAGTPLDIPALDVETGEAEVQARAGEAVASSSGAGGAYVVQPGDTLSAIAARAGVSLESLAAYNGLDPEGLLLAGS